MNEVRKCPKCGGEMKNGHVKGSAGQMELLTCENCGYTELNIESKE